MNTLVSSYLELPERFYERSRPATFPDPKLVLLNDGLAEELGLSFAQPADAAAVLSGQRFLAGSEPIAQAYAGSQFGHFVPQLGDGRAHLLGEAKGFDIQLKGSGRTAFSRRGDGRSALGPVVREFLVSEAMYALGIPTTRSLAIVTTGEQVLRQDGPEPGGILTRVAESHIRIGTFQYFACRDDNEGLALLADYTIRRHFPNLIDLGPSERCLALLREVGQKQRDLVASWYALGFIHGVMNTDNCSLAGITIDYGPCAFMDEFRFHKVFSSIDHQGRYAYSNQMAVLKWNIAQLADCLLPLIHNDREQATALADEALGEVFGTYGEALYEALGRKLGFAEYKAGDEQIVQEFLRFLEDNELDFTLSFSRLSELLAGDDSSYPKTEALKTFAQQWRARNPDPHVLKAANPVLIPRNHQIQRAIDRANQGDYSPLMEMWEALKTPFMVQDKHKHLLMPPKAEERVKQTFCGT